ncbi:hypothetical protein NQ318_004094 [Aromia moschata]|uniref:RRM domain-containing protein n=1 Tax=Aromia moschata TaxID=1265417 RepID=A0AAV8XUC9_9CUCU|nr:hypothetical protein NQ318_004094 [Aromia moschata]
MSRLIVKNLPKNVTEENLRLLFGEKGTITDIQLKYTPSGRFRRFGFVGYQNENEAEEAIKAFNLTFINTSRITVENCTLLGKSAKVKWGMKRNPELGVNMLLIAHNLKKNNKTDNDNINNSEIKQQTKKKEKLDEAAELLKKYKDDPSFEEFLQLHAPKDLEKLHDLQSKPIENEKEANTNDISENENDSDDEESVINTDKLANADISDMEYMRQLMQENKDSKPRQKMEKKVKEKINLFTVKLRDLPYNTKKKDIKQFFKPITPYSIRIPRNIHGIAYVGFKTEKLFNKALVKDRSFINGKRVSVVKYTCDGINNNNNNEEGANNVRSKWKNQEEALLNEETIAESGRIFIRNLAYTTTEEDIENLFSNYGPVTEINLPVDTTTRKIKGFGVVTFLMPEHAAKAYSELDGSILHGRMVHLLPGKTKDVDDSLEETTDYKKKKSAKQKSQAGSAHNWNSLFLGHDAVAEVIADTYGTSKEAVVGPEGKGSAAVRLALGETQIVAQTRKYLEEEGVILDAFNNVSVKRSKTIILVKNLPSRTEAREISEIFKKTRRDREGHFASKWNYRFIYIESIKSMIIIITVDYFLAIVEFLEPSEARKAFIKLAYSKFKNVPLYLEWAPENSLNPAKIKKHSEPEEKTEESPVEINEEKAEDNNEEEDEPEPDTTLFVKNLNFKTSDEALRKHFEGCGKIHYANVATKKDKNDPKNILSMGYGFVRFKLKVSADKALKTLQQSVLDGKSLELKRSERTFKNDVNSIRKTTDKSKQTGTKLLVRNVPFQAKKKEIHELFSTFGEIKALRLPKKMAAGSDSHRGFAFVDFAVASDAKAAFDALSQSTHLYGRRLVLEWAANEEAVDELRKKDGRSLQTTRRSQI